MVSINAQELEGAREKCAREEYNQFLVSTSWGVWSWADQLSDFEKVTKRENDEKDGE